MDEEEIELAEALGAEPAVSVQNLTIYVPSADRHGTEIPNQAYWVKESATLLAHLGGGVTILPPVDGGWLSPTGEIVWEKPIIVYSYIKPDQFLERLDELRSFLHRMGRETDQGEIACQFDGRFYRITDFDQEVM